MILRYIGCCLMVLGVSFTAFGQSRSYKEGYLIIKGGITQKGYIKHTNGSWSVWGSKPGKVKFKFTPEGKAIKAKDDVVGFVIETDSFTVKNNITVSDLAPPFKRDFVKVEEVGRIKLYRHQCSSTTMTGSGMGGAPGIPVVNGHGTLILSKNGIAYSIYKIKRQKEQILRLFADDADIHAELQSKKPREWDIQDVVRRYNTKYVASYSNNTEKISGY